MKEQRYLAGSVALETRSAEDNAAYLVGRALVFGSMSVDLGGFREVNAPGCLEGCDMSDVVMLYNHSERDLLGRTSSGTLVLNRKDDGLYTECRLATDTRIGADVAAWVKRGDIQGMSYAFQVADDDWVVAEDGVVVRTVLKMKRLWDVSAVVHPAYPASDVKVRSLYEAKLGELRKVSENAGDDWQKLDKVRRELLRLRER